MYTKKKEAQMQQTEGRRSKRTPVFVPSAEEIALDAPPGTSPAAASAERLVGSGDDQELLVK